MADLLQLNYRTAWRLLHKIRPAMKERDANYKLSDMIEMDDAYFGSPRAGTDGRGTSKAKVSVAVKTDEKGNPVYIRMNVMEAVTSKELLRIAEDCIVPGSTILSDGLYAYRKLNENYNHPGKKKVLPVKGF